MPSYSPELVETMRAALDEVMTKIPPEKATPAIKAYLVHTKGCRRGPDQLREPDGCGLRSNPHNSFDANLSVGDLSNRIMSQR